MDFLIVGGGIGGAVLAELLGRAGKKVVLLEKNAGPPQYLRPEILWPATIDVLCSLIPRATWEEDAALPLRGIEVNDGKRVRSLISPGLLDDLKIQPWLTNPNLTRERLLGLESYEARRGVEVTSVLKEKDRIVGVRALDVTTAKEREWLAHLTIGDDGPQSIIRKAAGLQMERTMFPLDFHCFGFDWPSRLNPTVGQVWLNESDDPSGIIVLAAGPLPQGKGIGFVAARPKISDSAASVTEPWKRFCHLYPGILEVVGERVFPDDFMCIRRGWGHVPRYGVAGAILIGDAAHPVTPVGGQGANMSVADACVLARLARDNQANVLEEYERLRRPANDRSLEFSKWATRLWTLPEWCGPVSLFQMLLRGLSHYPTTMRHALQTAATAFQTKT